MIHFVQHHWLLNEDKTKENQDSFSLDILDGEINRANANPPQPYDPTFTHSPRGTDPRARPIVYPSPNGIGNTVILQVDEPGLRNHLYQRFLKHGGIFGWNFISMLVCITNDGTATDYQESGQVEQQIR